MKRKSIKGIYSRSMQEKATDPIIENDKLPSMDDSGYQKPPESKKGKAPGLMEKAPGKMPVVTKKAIKEGKMMSPFTKEKQKEDPVQHYGEQLGKSSRKSESGYYIVFRMHVQNGVISVTGCKRVDSGLARHEDLLSGGLTYEATINDTRLNLASIPDFGEQRSFPRPPGEKGEQGHHITTLPGFDFNVRIPGDKITEKDLPKLKVTLYRFKEHVPEVKLSEATLKSQFEKETRIVAELDGIRTSALSKDVKAVITKAFEK